VRSKWLSITLIIVLFIIGFAGGVIYWSLKKAKDISDGALKTSKNIESVLTPTPSAPASSKPGGLTLPSQDIEGKDIEGVPRYSGAMINEYSANDDSSIINITYIAQGKAADILSYYETNLTQGDWILRSKDDKSQNFSKEEINLAIEIAQEDLENNLVEFKIHYFHTSSQ
jgi:hypothetical protein